MGLIIRVIKKLQIVEIYNSQPKIMIFQVEDTIIVDKKVLVNQTLFKKFRHMTLKVQATFDLYLVLEHRH